MVVSVSSSRAYIHFVALVRVLVSVFVKLCIFAFFDSTYWVRMWLSTQYFRQSQ